MLISLALLLIPVLLIGVGIWLVSTPLDILWLRQERSLLSRGISSKRNPAWEESVRGRGWVFITLGIVLLFLSGPIMKSAAITNLKHFLQWP